MEELSILAGILGLLLIGLFVYFVLSQMTTEWVVSLSSITLLIGVVLFLDARSKTP